MSKNTSASHPPWGDGPEGARVDGPEGARVAAGSRAEELLNAALVYRSLGWFPFPVHGIKIENGKNICTCGAGARCKSAGKHPVISGWIEKAEKADEEQLKKWFGTEGFGEWCNIAISCKGITIIDVDTESHGAGIHGEAALERMEEKHGKLDKDVECITGGGGRHLYFYGETKNDVDMKVVGADNLPIHGLDVRSSGGLVVVPPSMHQSGRQYEWEGSSDPMDGAVPSRLPEAWRKAIMAGGEKTNVINLDAHGPGAAAGLRVMDREQREEVRQALVYVDASNYERWIKVGHVLRQYEGGFHLWEEYSMRCPEKYHPAACREKWMSFRNKGARGVPGEPGGDVDIGSIFVWAEEDSKQEYINPQSDLAKKIRDRNEALKHAADEARRKEWLDAQQVGAWSEKQQQREDDRERRAQEERAWTPGSIPVAILEEIRGYLYDLGLGRTASIVGTLAIASVCASRRWEMDGEPCNIFQGLVCTGGQSGGRAMIAAVEEFLCNAGLEALIHQDRAEKHLQVKRAFWYSPACIFTSNSLAGIARGGTSVVRQQAQQAANDLVVYGYYGRTVMLSREGMRGVTGKDGGERGRIIRPAASVITSMSDRVLPMLYSAENLGNGNIEPYIMAFDEGDGGGYTGNAAASMDREPGEDDEDIATALAEQTARFVGVEYNREDGAVIPASDDALFDQGAGYRGKVREVSHAGGLPRVADMAVYGEEAGVHGSDWVDGYNAHAAINATRVAAILGAWDGGHASNEIIGWASAWVGHWHLAALRRIRIVGGASEGRLSLAEAVEGYLVRMSPGGATDRDLKRSCKPFRSASREERDKAVSQLIEDGRAEWRKEKKNSARTTERLYIVEAMV